MYRVGVQSIEQFCTVKVARNGLTPEEAEQNTTTKRASIRIGCRVSPNSMALMVWRDFVEKSNFEQSTLANEYGSCAGRGY